MSVFSFILANVIYTTSLYRPTSDRECVSGRSDCKVKYPICFDAVPRHELGSQGCSCCRLASMFDPFSVFPTGTRGLGGSNVMATLKTRWLLSILLTNCFSLGGKLGKGLCTYFLYFVSSCVCLCFMLCDFMLHYIYFIEQLYAVVLLSLLSKILHTKYMTT